jgi:hypothetical protein
MTGKPMRSTISLASSAPPTRPLLPGTVGTPASAATRRAATLSPSSRIASPDGPTNFMPAATTASAKSAFSERKP